MRFRVDADSPLPLYAQLERGVRAGIASGELPEGARLPTVRQLAVELSINANTVARVYAELEREGVLATQRGVGTFVRHVKPPTRSNEQKRRDLDALVERLLAEASALGITTGELLRHFEARIKEKE
jgi:GntR family transcriptional regulator